MLVTFTDDAGSDTVRYSDFVDDDVLGNIRVIESNESFHFIQVAYGDFSDSISVYNDDGDVTLEHERYGAFALTAVE